MSSAERAGKRESTGVNRFENLKAVRQSQETHLPSAVEPIHERQERGNDGGVNLILLHTADRCQAVNLVKKNDRWLHEKKKEKGKQRR